MVFCFKQLDSYGDVCRNLLKGGWERLRAKNTIIIIRDVFYKRKPGCKKKTTFKDSLKIKIKLFILILIISSLFLSSLLLFLDSREIIGGAIHRSTVKLLH